MLCVKGERTRSKTGVPKGCYSRVSRVRRSKRWSGFILMRISKSRRVHRAFYKGVKGRGKVGAATRFRNNSAVGLGGRNNSVSWFVD